MPRVAASSIAPAVLIVVAVRVATAMAATASVPATRAVDHVGKRVTIEGRVVATHASPLATVLAFAPNFAGFTATILAADRGKFPADLEGRYQGRLVRVTGLVTAYRSKPEMALHDPSQLELVSAPGETPAPVGTPGVALTASSPGVPIAVPSPSPEILAEETRRLLAQIEERLAALEGRLAAVEQALAAQVNATRAARQPPRLAVGLGTGEVRAFLGNPIEVDRGIQGRSRWIYGAGRSVTFDRNGRVIAWSGF